MQMEELIRTVLEHDVFGVDVCHLRLEETVILPDL